MSTESLHRYLDHAVLKPQYSRAEARREIEIGVIHKVRSVCVRPMDISMALEICEGSETDLGCVLAFPHGVALSKSKADEARHYLELGVAEIDMVVNYGLVRSHAWVDVEADIRAVSEVTRPAGVIMKVILETSELETSEIARATECAVAAHADFVKTSTGFASGGASVDAVKTMIAAGAGKIRVKASGGIRDRKTALEYIELGCTRLGVGSSTTPLLCGDAEAAPSGEAY